ncbi:hypothetical protein CC1G_13570 [Coprinopsis cinerea okayama7|uniref:CHAT domain-containing protein n=1 Tax=Coprinopsis cinerea (strain Okayama-7 / 130 / ATCC MYA-4618 / FGSC 9003) TaxID=240176 RepID=D6RJN1_COPC7|nr:hypothetical protein CC1G_13570 [Coprinopsis cinerea okayama7\|eukprot:XP_002912042.1 hypothetical protein CC1G_13570 [Coprinopsis cinerea okayama7\
MGEPSVDIANISSQAITTDGPSAGGGPGAFKQVGELVESVKKRMRDDLLEKAVASLLQTIDKEADDQKRLVAGMILVKALLTRFARYGWANDLEQVRSLLRQLADGEGNFIIPQWNGVVDESFPETHHALGLLHDYHQSIDESGLESAIVLAEQLIDSGPMPTEDHRICLVHSGNCDGSYDARRLSSNPWTYIALLNLEHVAMIKMTEGRPQRKVEGLEEARAYAREALAADEKGSEAHAEGTAMMKADHSQLDAAISLFRQSLSHRPFPHPKRHDTVASLAVALFTRFKRNRSFDDLEEAIDLQQQALVLRPAGHPDRYVSLNSLASFLSTRFEHRGDMGDLEDSITRYRDALGCLPINYSNRATLLNNIAVALSIRFQQKGDLKDLEESISHHREALTLRPTGHPDRSATLVNLAIALSTVSEHKPEDDSKGLEEAISLHREALALYPVGNPQRSMSLINLANSLTTQFERKGDLKGIEEAIIHYREAMELRPTNHPGRANALSSLATALSTRFEHVGDIQDLEECIRHHREALGLRPIGHPGRFMPLNNLAAALSTRFEHKGNSEDLEECIRYHREALDLRPAGHPSRFMPLSNLATSLYSRFQHNGDFEDLQKSIGHFREALDLLPTGHPGRFMPLNNLANCLVTRLRKKGDFHDLDESIRYHREALGLRPPGHASRCMPLNNLANSLSTRYEHKGDIQDLQESIRHHREGLGLLPTDHPSRFMPLNNLANSLSTWFKHSKNIQDLDECIRHYREALSLRPPGHPGRFMPLNNLAIAHFTRFSQRPEENFLDLQESIARYREALETLPVDHPDRSESLSNLASALSTRFQHKHDLEDLRESIRYLREALSALTQCDDTAALPDSAATRHPAALGVTFNLVKSLLQLHDHLVEQATVGGSGHKDVEEIFHLLNFGSHCDGALLLVRLQHAALWSVTARMFDRPKVALEAYKHGLSLLPLLASLDMTLEQRQNVLVHAKDLSSDAVQLAIDQKALEMAVVFLSTSRSVFWTQALQFRASLERLESAHPSLASELRSVNRQLENATHHMQSADFKATSPYLLTEQREKILARIRGVKEFHDFLLPPTFETLKTASQRGPVVFLNASRYGCHALILKQDCTLLPLSLDIDIKKLRDLRVAVQRMGRGLDVDGALRSSIDDLAERRELRLKLGRLSRQTEDDRFRQVLEVLWLLIAESVVSALELEKADVPGRIWWCPTGPFAFLPIHAAGIYSNTSEESDCLCLSNYAVSSYCSTPQDLIASPPELDSDFKMLVAIEPEAPETRVSGLPWTLKELERIESRIPDKRNLIIRVGPTRTPADEKTILEDIRSSSIVHFGCHGVQEESPLDSCLFLSSGRLTISSLIRDCQTSSPALAYLSACETAKGDEERPDESLSLAATMRFAGFRSVVATMWPIHDEDGPVVADVFYRHLFRRGLDSSPDITVAAYALHIAVKELREKDVSFSRWVPFVHHGI